ncbi:ubiquitin-like protein 4B [Octodon degus]|uniref:Ubiquitin-like protein 4B n=1 Tax=Octodon degus TaxID=10160 RepID=A0A6P3VC14_OCTDE|nr:ubiquitin-like protein 4B [Octodon degus]
MFLTVKLLLGRKCSLKVSEQESVATLKKLVSEQLQVPEEQQHLMFRGQPLDDDKCLSDYCIGPNASINVIMRPLGTAAADKALQSQDQTQPLWHQLDRVLAKHFRPQDAKAVLRLLRQEHEERLQRVGPEALEQLARHLLAEQQHRELAVEREAQSSCNREEEEGEEASPAAESLALTRPAPESSLRHGAPPPGWPFGKRGNRARRAPPSSVPLRRAGAARRGRRHSARPARPHTPGPGPTHSPERGALEQAPLAARQEAGAIGVRAPHLGRGGRRHSRARWEQLCAATLGDRRDSAGGVQGPSPA